jgi:hypothetical protein
MRSPSACDVLARAALGRRRWIVGGICASLLAAAPGAARAADEKQACSAAYDQVQVLREARKLAAAREQAAVCLRDVCAAFIRTDCAKWFGEIEASQPTVVFEVRDAAGKETNAVRVDLDGKPWVAALDGKSRPIDPGQHTLHYVAEGGGVLDDTVQIREGEKNRKLYASFQKAAPVAPVLPVVAPAPGRGEAPSRSSAPWIIGGIGLAGLAVGGILGGVVLHDKAVTNDPNQCSATLRVCTTAGASAEQQGKTLGPASTAGLVVGGVGVAVAAVWLIVRGSAKGAAPVATVGLGPATMAGGGGWTLCGRW